MLDGSRDKDPYTTPIQPLSYLYSPRLCVSCTVYLYIERCSIILRLVEWGKKTKFHLWHFSLVPIMGPATLLETTSSFSFPTLLPSHYFLHNAKIACANSPPNPAIGSVSSIVD